MLVCTVQEDHETRHIIFNDVLQAQARPVRETFRAKDESGVTVTMYRYRFHMKYLEDLMLTFPFAEFSPGLDKRLSQEARKKFDAMKVPDIWIEDFDAELFDFQKISVDIMLRKKKFINNDEMGLGKTFQAVATLVGKRAFPAIIVVPNSVVTVWKRVIEEFTPFEVTMLSGTNSERAAQIRQRSDITIINCESLRMKVVMDDSDPDDPEVRFEPRLPDLFNFEYEMAVVDEYHRFKNPDAQQTIGLHHLQAKRKFVMSGTPLLNGRPEELWSVLHWLWPDRFPTAAEFERKHCIKKGSRVVAYRGLKDLKNFMYDGEQARAIRRRKDQVLSDLPEVVYVDRIIQLTPEQRRLYNEIRDELRLWIEDNPRRIFNALAQMTRLKQAAFSPELYGGSQHSAKIVELKEIMKELVGNGEKAIVFSQWKDGVDILARELAEYNPAIVTGDVPVTVGSERRGNMRYPRQEQIDMFNEDDDCKVFLGTIGACKEGFTLSAATYVIFMDKDWVPANNMQAAARSAAGGLRGLNAGVDHVHIIEIRAEDTIEEYIEDLLTKKQIMNERMTEQDGGASVDRISIQDIRELLR